MLITKLLKFIRISVFSNENYKIKRYLEISYMHLFDDLRIHDITYMTYLNNTHNTLDNITYLYYFFYQGFLSRTFTIHKHLDISWVITAESAPLHIGSSRA